MCGGKRGARVSERPPRRYPGSRAWGQWSSGTLTVSVLFCLTYMFISWNLCIYITVVAQTDSGKIPERNSASPTCVLTGQITTTATLSARPLVPHTCVCACVCVCTCRGENSPRPPHIQRPTEMTFWTHAKIYYSSVAGRGARRGGDPLLVSWPAGKAHRSRGGGGPRGRACSCPRMLLDPPADKGLM